jgi:hypothetical protein
VVEEERKKLKKIRRVKRKPKEDIKLIYNLHR